MIEWGLLTREHLDAIDNLSTGPSVLAKFQDGAGRTSPPGSRLPAPARLLEPLPSHLRAIDAAVKGLEANGHAEAMQVIRWEYVHPCRFQRESAKAAGIEIEHYRRRLYRGRRAIDDFLEGNMP